MTVVINKETTPQLRLTRGGGGGGNLQGENVRIVFSWIFQSPAPTAEQGCRELIQKGIKKDKSPDAAFAAGPQCTAALRQQNLQLWRGQPSGRHLTSVSVWLRTNCWMLPSRCLCSQFTCVGGYGDWYKYSQWPVPVLQECCLFAETVFILVS